MGKQLPDVSCKYGAPMGRHSYGLIENCEPRTVRLFKVDLDSGGYDDGGAYWGSRLNGHSLYCATDFNTFFNTVDAFSRCHAALLLDIEPAQLKQPLLNLAFGRYSAIKCYHGKTEPGFEISEFGQRLTIVDSWEDLCAFAQEKEKA